MIQSRQAPGIFVRRPQCHYKNPYEFNPKEEMEACLKTWEERGELTAEDKAYWKDYMKNGDRFNPVLQKQRKEQEKKIQERANQYKEDLKQEGIIVNND